MAERRWPTCVTCGSPMPDGAPGTPVQRALLPISEPARRIHRCDERCICPADGKPLAYAPAHGLHACSDPGCRYAHPRGQEDDRG